MYALLGFQTFFTFNSRVRHLQGVTKPSFWSQASKVVSDLPVCGLRGELCVESSYFTQQLSAGLASVTAVGVLVIVAYLFRYRTYAAYMTLSLTHVSFNYRTDNFD